MPSPCMKHETMRYALTATMNWGCKMGQMVCLCGKRYSDPINMYTQEKDPFFICMDKCLSDRSTRPSYEEVHEHNSNYEYKKGGMIWGK